MTKLFIGMNSNGGCVPGVIQDIAVASFERPKVATNTLQDLLDFQRENIGKAEGVPINYVKHAAEIVRLWPRFLEMAKAKGVNTADPEPIWGHYVSELFATLEARDRAATQEALAAAKKAVAPNAESPAEVIADAMRTAERYRAQAKGADGLDATERDICRRLGITAEQYLASPSGERR